MKLNDIYKKIQAYDEALNEAASASINMSGDNAEDVIKLMNALKGEKGSDTIDSMPTAISKPIAPMPVMGPPSAGDDMAKLRDIVDGPKDDMDMDDLKPGKQEPCKICGKAHLGNSGCGESIEEEADSEQLSAWYEKYNKYDNADIGSLADGMFKFYMDSGVDLDAIEKSEYNDLVKKYGEDEITGDALRHLDEMPITKAMFDEFEKIMGQPADEESSEKAVSMLGLDEGYENEPDEKYQDQHYMTKDLSGGSEQGQKRSYAPTNGGDNPMALEDEIRNELKAQLEAHMGEGEEGDHDHEDGECPECGEPGKKKLMACASCGCS